MRSVSFCLKETGLLNSKMNTAEFMGLGILVIYLGAIAFGIFGLLERKTREIPVDPEPETEDTKED